MSHIFSSCHLYVLFVLLKFNKNQEFSAASRFVNSLRKRRECSLFIEFIKVSIIIKIIQNTFLFPNYNPFLFSFLPFLLSIFVTRKIKINQLERLQQKTLP